MRVRTVWVLVALFVVAGAFASYTTWVQYRSFEDDRTFEERAIDFGVYVDGNDKPPSLDLTFRRTENATVIVAMQVGLSAPKRDRDNLPDTVATCYLMVPPGTEIASAEDIEDNPDLANYATDLAIYKKWARHWIYSMSCGSPAPTNDRLNITWYDTQAAFKVSGNNFYRTKYDQYELEFHVAGVDGNGPVLVSTSRPGRDERAFFNKIDTMALGLISYEVDGQGWDVEPHLPGGTPVRRQTSSLVSVSRVPEMVDHSLPGGREPAVADGTIAVTMTRSSGRATLAVIQLVSVLLLGVLADRLWSAVFESRPSTASSPTARNSTPPPPRTRPSKSSKKSSKKSRKKRR